MKRASQYFVYLLVRVALAVAQSLRPQTCAKVAQAMAYVTAEVLHVRKKVIRENLLTAFPQLTDKEIRRLTRHMWEHLYLMAFEIALAPRKLHHTNWRQHVTLYRKQEIIENLLQPRPVILVSAHFGNFEAAGYMTGLLGFRTYTIARTLDNPYLNAYVNRMRGNTGQYILPKQGSSEQVEAVLAAGETLVLLGDQHAGPKGCWVDFFGRPASCHKAVALFTLGSGGPLMIGYLRRLSRKPLHFEVGMFGTADPALNGPEVQGVKPLTQWYNSRLEDLVRRDPGQYWWLHRRWKGEPPVRKRAVRRGDEASGTVPPPHGDAAPAGARPTTRVDSACGNELPP